VTLERDENKTVEFENIEVTVDPGEYEHGVFSEDDQETATIEVLEDDDVDEVSVAVADNELDTDAFEEALLERGYAEEEAVERIEELRERQDAGEPLGADALADFLDDELDSDDYTVTELDADDLLDNTDHDVYVINHFGDTDVGDFYDALDDDQAVIYLDQAEDVDANAVTELSNELGDPGETDFDFAGGEGADLHITEDHPLFDGVGEEGDTIAYHDGFDADRLWFDDYSGETLADISGPGDDPDGGAVGVHDDDNQILLASSGRTDFVLHDEFTDEEHTLMINAVEYAAEEYVGLTSTESLHNTMDGASAVPPLSGTAVLTG